MGIDYYAVCHSRREWTWIGRLTQMKESPILEWLATGPWYGLPLMVISDGGSFQDLVFNLRNPNPAMFGHLDNCDLPRACTCYEYREVSREEIVASLSP